METVADSNLSEQERIGLRALLDVLIPPDRDGRMPGAGELGLVQRVETQLAKQEGLVAIVQAGLAALDAGAGAAFAELEPARRRAVVDRVAEAHPALVPSLVFFTYVAYYEHPQIRVALGREARPAHPGGYELEPFDPELVARVRRRAPFFREV